MPTNLFQLISIVVDENLYKIFYDLCKIIDLNLNVETLNIFTEQLLKYE